MIKVRILDGEGSGRHPGVTEEHALKVAVVTQSAHTIPTEELIRQKVLREFLAEPAGSSTDLNVDGSVTPVEFVITAVPGVTKWVTGLRILLNGVNMEMDTNDFRRFGAATASQTPLTNGIEMFVEQVGSTSQFYVDPIQTMGQFLDYADRFTNIVNAVSTQSDFLSFDFDFDVPVVLPPGTTDKVAVKVSDDLTAIDLFKVIARGYREIESTE
jgi:hypothetical protein